MADFPLVNGSTGIPIVNASTGVPVVSSNASGCACCAPPITVLCPCQLSNGSIGNSNISGYTYSFTGVTPPGTLTSADVNISGSIPVDPGNCFASKVFIYNGGSDAITIQFSSPMSTTNYVMLWTHSPSGARIFDILVTAPEYLPCSGASQTFINADIFGGMLVLSTY